MKEMMDEEKDQWKAWVHDCRTNLIHTGVDWVIHLGHDGKKKPDHYKHSMLVNRFGMMD